MNRILILFFLLYGCSNNPQKPNLKVYNEKISPDLSLKEFRIKLEAYANKRPHPKIDE
jgi:hypothetical protein